MARLLGWMQPLLTLVAAPFGAPAPRPRHPLTEAEWQACKDLPVMLDFLLGRASERALHLFAVACCRRVWDLLPDERSRAAVETFERYAEGQAGAPELQAALKKAWEVGPNAASYLASEDALLVAFRAAGDRARASDPKASAASASERAAQCDLLRDVCDPFHPGIVDAGVIAWNCGAVPRLARAAYERRRFEDLPILADALEEAGCTDARLLRHCRAGGKHVRGCWAVDLLLGKK